MAADDFATAPSEVVELPPAFNNIITTTESEKKEFLNLSVTPIRVYRLKFNAQSTAVKDAILAHHDARYGGYDDFTWTSVPDHVNSGANLQGRWIDGSIRFIPIGYKLWNISIDFEKST